ncbi:FAD-binding oxidoreductase [Dehalococcoidia bacterium]|nr:FAD-binding oxidoreductase [Dehalococcoidia bacterium]
MSSNIGAVAKQVAQRVLGDGGAVMDPSGYVIDRAAPAAVARPETVEELGRLMVEANSADLSVAPVGGRTRLSLGNPPRRLDLVADSTGLNQVVSYSPADLTGTFEAGMTFTDLNAVLAEHGQFLALDPPLPDRATIGGTLAAGVSGPLKWQYGSPRDLVIGMKIVQADGSLTKSGGQVVKNVSGYDMARLHVGGLGTLGIIAEVSLKLTPLPADEKTVLAAFRTAADCAAAAIQVFNSPMTPLALTAYDASVQQMAGLPVLDGSHFLAVRLMGRARTLERAQRESIGYCRENGASTTEVIEGAVAINLWRELADFGWRPEALPEVTVRLSTLPARTLVDSQIRVPLSGLRPAVITDPGYGRVSVYWFSESDESALGGLTSSAAAMELTLNQARAAGATAIVERCPPELKTGLDVWGDVGDALAIMRRLKVQYDPKGILNPGRFAGLI